MLNSSRRAPYTPIRNVQRVRRPLCDGRYNFHYYHRPTRTKLPGQPGSPEFMRVYEECERRLSEQTLAPDANPFNRTQPPSINCNSPICDYRPRCALIADLFPHQFALAQRVICATPHLAEALWRLGLTACGKASIDMALAIQEARTDPPSLCSCRLAHCAAA